MNIRLSVHEGCVMPNVVPVAERNIENGRFVGVRHGCVIIDDGGEKLLILFYNGDTWGEHDGPDCARYTDIDTYSTE